MVTALTCGAAERRCGLGAGLLSCDVVTTNWSVDGDRCGRLDSGFSDPLTCIGIALIRAVQSSM